METTHLKLKLILTLSAILVAAFMSISLVNYHMSSLSVREEIVTRALPLTRDNIYSEITKDLSQPIMVASTMSNDTFLQDWASHGEDGVDRIQRYLGEMRDRYGYFAAFFVSAATGRYYHPGGVLKKISRADDHDIWYYDFIGSGREYDLDVDTNEAGDNIWTIFINFRVTDAEGRLLGVTGVGLKLERVAAMLESYQAKYTRRIYLTDVHGTIQVHPDITQAAHRSIRDQEGIGAIADEVLTVREEPGIYEYEADDKRIILTSRFLPDLKWFLLVEEDVEAALATARMNLLRTLGIGLGASVIIILMTILAINHYQERLERMASTDELTGVDNRRRFESHFQRAVAAKARHGRDFSVILMDLDGFKQVNDTLGHLAGDEVLRRVAALISATVRAEDVVARWGGDEFIVLTEGGQEQSLVLAERLRAAVEDARLPGGDGAQGRKLCVGLSLGVAGHQEGDDLDSLTGRADVALYAAKSQGGGRAVCA